LYNYNDFLKILENTSFLAPSKNTRISYVTTMVHGAWAMWSRFFQCTMHGVRKVQEKVLRSFSEETRCDVDGYPKYQRRQTRIFVDPKTQRVVDN
jgi:hypothetical protein